MKAHTVYASLIGLAQLTKGQFKPLPQFPGSVTSSGPDNLELFIADYSGDILYKNHANSKAGWSKGFEYMNMTTYKTRRPSAVTLGKDQTHVFANCFGTLTHRYWDGSQWQPSEDWEDLEYTLGTGNLAVTTRGTNRIHIVTKDEANKYYGHKYYDGTAWKPDGNESLEDFGHDGFGEEYFESDPVVSSWGKDRLDIFGILSNGTLLHKYWDGYQWQPSISAWEQWGDKLQGAPTVTSWGKDRLDVWALNTTGSGRDTVGQIVHRFWDGHTLSAWENLDGWFDEGPSVTNWAPNRHDVFTSVGAFTFYKYWNGSHWTPSLSEDEEEPWIMHTEFSYGKTNFGSKQLSTSWGKDNLHLFGVSDKGTLQWQKLDGNKWSPSNETYEDLGEVYASERISEADKLKRMIARSRKRGHNGSASQKHEHAKVNKHWSQLLVQNDDSLDL